MEISKLHGTTDTLEAQFKVRKNQLEVYFQRSSYTGIAYEVRDSGLHKAESKMRSVEMCDATVPLILRPFSEHFLDFLGMLDVLGGGGGAGGGPSGTPSAKFHRSHWSPFQNCQNWSTVFRGWFGLQTPIFEAYVITFPMILGITIWGCPKVMEVPPVLIHLNVGFSKTIVSCSTPIYGNLHFLANPSISGPPWWVPLAKEQILMPRNAPAPGDGSDRLCLGKLKPEKPWSQHTYPLVNYHT